MEKSPVGSRRKIPSALLGQSPGESGGEVNTAETDAVFKDTLYFDVFMKVCSYFSLALCFIFV